MSTETISIRNNLRKIKALAAKCLTYLYDHKATIYDLIEYSSFSAICLFFIDYSDGISKFLNEYKILNTIQNTAASLVDKQSLLIFLQSLTLLVIFFIAIKIVKHKIIPVLFDKQLNTIDKFALHSFTISALYFVLIQLAEIASYYKVAIIMTTYFIFFTYSLLRVYCALKIHKNSHPQIISLATLYKQSPDNHTQDLLIEDNECDDDIFDREIIIKKIYSIARAELGGKSFTLSLVGPWGSGKSTILKILKRKIESEKDSKIIFVDDFQPWIYENTKTMVAEFGRILLEKIGYEKLKISSKTLAETLMKTASSLEPSGVLGSIKIPEHKKDPIGIINRYLQGRNKKLIITLDNLERCEPNQIIRLLRIINNHLQFTNSLYILSYDDEIMRKELANNELNESFLDKFSQCTIAIPDIPEDLKREVVETCFKNYFKITESKEGDNFKQFITAISETIKTPRQLVHAINSSYVGDVEFLNHFDSTLINILKQNAPKLYDLIRDNESKFVYNQGVVFSVRNPHEEYARKTINSYCESEANFFKSIQENIYLANDFICFRPILKILFPNISLFLDGNNNSNIFGADIQNEAYEESFAKRRINRHELFSIYFTQTKNKYIEVCNTVDEILNQTDDAIKDLILLHIKNQDNEYVDDVLLKLKERIGELGIEKRNTIALDILDIVFNNRDKKDSNQRITFDNAIDFLAVAIYKTDQNTFSKIIKTLKSNYKNLDIINILARRTRTIEKNNNTERYFAINELLNNTKNEIITKKINLYTKNDYLRLNIKNIGSHEHIIEYLTSIKNYIPKKNQILVLADFIYWGGSGKKNLYEVDDNTLESIFSKTDIENIIKNAKSSNLKKAIKRIYYNASAEEKGYMQGNRVYVCDEYIPLFDLCEDYLNS